MGKEHYASSYAKPKSERGPVPLPIVIAPLVVVLLIIIILGIWRMSHSPSKASALRTPMTAQQQSDGQWIVSKLKSSQGKWSNLSPDEQQRANIITKGHGQQVFGN